MQISLKWLKDYVDFDLSPALLAERLTMAGLEVDAIEEIAPAFSGVRTAKIRSIRRHPDADKLSLCEVTTGEATYPIVCGAGNIQVGDVVPLAAVGAVLPNGDVVRSSRIRGEVSEGMLCSEAELAIGDDAKGIMILPPDSPLGQDLENLLDLRDTVLDIGVTPNRSDCLSLVGVAREVAAMTGGTLSYPSCDVQESEEDIRGITSVSILDPDLCPRYTARLIKGLRVGPSPFWLRRRLEALGLRSINNIVDVTNFVMLELGQPLHAFDYRFLEEGRIVVRRAREGEPFVSLDGKERCLKGGTLLICDGVKPVAIGGVMGGLNSEVKADTQTVLLESAYFYPPSIRRTARALAMGTDAAFRFERGIDPEGVLRALDRAASLMAELAGGRVCGGVIDQYPQPIESAKEIMLHTLRVGEILGTTLPEQDMVQVLRNLEMIVEPAGEGCFQVTPPTCRIDITREIDLIEEIARLSGYDRITATLPTLAGVAEAPSAPRRMEAQVRAVLTGAGYSEVINYSFVSADAIDWLGLSPTDERRTQVRIRNPLTEEQAVLRTTLCYSLLLNARRNADAGRPSLKIFETGRTFIAKGEGVQPREEDRLACLISGLRFEDRWDEADRPVDFYDLKGIVESLLATLRLSDLSYKADQGEVFLHPGKSCGVFSGAKRIGFIGEVHPDLLARMDLNGAVVVCELSLDVMETIEIKEVTFRNIPRFPASGRDVAFLVQRNIESAELLRLATETPEELLEKVHIFDVYEGQNIPAGMRSLGLRFSYRSPERTLTDEEVNEVHARIVRRIVVTAGAEIR
jgi:phenylalanyl-tRNA synthetase beta chain